MADKRVGCEAGKKRERKFIRYREGAEKYSMGLSKFQQLSREAKYLEGFREC